MATNSRRKAAQEPTPRRTRPAMTEQERENELIGLAVDLTERQMRDGTASAQQITHFLKMGSSREKLEQQRLEEENKLLRAKVSQIESGERIEGLYSDAINAMRGYQGVDEEDGQQEYEEW